jgi:UDP-hydrolysing UDP-N-acetyl-D-glucosamine 2-epimerase
MRTIAVVTTSRADYGILRQLLSEIRNDPALRLQLIVSGMHVSPRFGNTYTAIEADDFTIDRSVPMLYDDDSDVAAAKSVAKGLEGMTDALSELRPDILVLCGDRFELLSAAAAALILRIPIAHIHGGETTEGAIDESIRHAITKFAVLHFTATQEYRRRVIQMGEQPDRVFAVGAPALDALHEFSPLSEREVEECLSLRYDGRKSLVTYHPVTTEKDTALEHIRSICAAVHESGIAAVFTASNADPEGGRITAYIKDFCAANPVRYVFHGNLGSRLYFSCLTYFDVLIGNSSSGLIEAPSFHIPVVNIGDRQKGRIRAGNVIDTGYSPAEIRGGIERALTGEFRNTLKNLQNPYHLNSSGGTSRKIKDILKAFQITDTVCRKSFFNIEFRGEI